MRDIEEGTLHRMMETGRSPDTSGIIWSTRGALLPGPKPESPVMAPRFTHLTTREDNRLARQQARTACAAASLRWIHVAITRQVASDPAIAGTWKPEPALV